MTADTQIPVVERAKLDETPAVDRHVSSRSFLPRSTTGVEQQPTLFRFATAGSVDDGKSTLVGRLLHDSKAILADQLEQVARTSADRGFAHGDFDFALLTDGLRATCSSWSARIAFESWSRRPTRVDLPSSTCLLYTSPSPRDS